MARSGSFTMQAKGYIAFIPSPLPPSPALLQDEELTYLMSQATLAVGRLSGLSQIIPDPDLFVYLYVRKEALLSSQIEGTQCSLEDILNPITEHMTEESTLQDIEEVSNYVRAMNEGLGRLNTLPVSNRLLKEMHSTLMAGVRGSNKTPGEFRKTQNWIGRPGASLANAEFVPPPPEDVERLMSDLEKFIHTKDRIPALIKAALIHAQFESIHPFLDGNGRLGRLLITYLLCTWDVLEKPLLYMSYHFKAHRTEYYARLMDVRTRDDWEGWVKFFLRGVKESAEMAVQTATDIHKLHTADRARVHASSPTGSTQLVYEQFCREPILTTAVLVERLKSTKPTIQKSIDALVALGLVQEVSGKKRGRRYAYSKYVDLLTRDTITPAG